MGVLVEKVIELLGISINLGSAGEKYSSRMQAICEFIMPEGMLDTSDDDEPLLVLSASVRDDEWWASRITLVEQTMMSEADTNEQLDSARSGLASEALASQWVALANIVITASSQRLMREGVLYSFIAHCRQSLGDGQGEGGGHAANSGADGGCAENSHTPTTGAIRGHHHSRHQAHRRV